MHHPVGGMSYDLTFGGNLFAHASLTTDGSYASLGCTNPQERRSFPTRVQVLVEKTKNVACTAYGNSDPKVPLASRVVLERTLGGAVQQLELEDALGKPWARLEIGEQVRLFDLSGRERVRITRMSDAGMEPVMTRLSLSCWDEQGQELAGQQYLMV